MANDSVIADVGEGIVRLLRKNLVPEVIPHMDAVGLCSPEEHGDMALGVYLYDIRRSEEPVGRGMRMEREDSQRYPSQFLTLHYMITAYSSSDLKFRAIQEQRILGRVIQALGDNAVLREEYLDENAAGASYPIRMEMLNIDSEEKFRVWNMPNLPYKLSLFYRVFPVEIRSRRVRDVRRVKEIRFAVDEKGDEGVTG